MDNQHHSTGFLVVTTLLICLAILSIDNGLVNIVVAQGEIPGITISDAGEEIQKHIAAVIPCKDMIDDGLYQSVQRRSQEAMAMGATYLIFEIGTYGGILKSGDDISKYFILDLGKKVHTVAYITTEAISAGAMISVACKDIIMLENTTIGDCAPVQIGGKLEGVEREKAESFTRAAFMRAAEANNYPEALLKAMVTQQLEVYRVMNLKTGEYEFFETKDVPKDESEYDIEGKKLIVKDDELLTLTATQAQEYGIARTQVSSFKEVLAFLEDRDGVVFSDTTIRLETNWSEELVRWLNSPAILGVLAMLAMLGVYVELNTPGLGIPGLLAVVCVVIIVGSKYLIGMANWVEVAVFMVGIILLLIEILVIPGFGLAGFLGIVCILGGMFGMLIKNPPDRLPWPRPEYGGWDPFIEGMTGIMLGFVGFVILACLIAKYLPKMQFLSGLMLTPAFKAEEIEIKASITAPPDSTVSGIDVGQMGEVTSPLRPAGSAKFGECLVDVVAEGQFLEKGDSVEIIEIHGNRVIVKKIEES